MPIVKIEYVDGTKVTAYPFSAMIVPPSGVPIDCLLLEPELIAQGRARQSATSREAKAE
ncbi:MAG: hypothetical protein AAGJ79_00235 [Verrucomicrobiota bacterium]